MLEEPGMTITGEFLGSPSYMSPEQIAAGRVKLDHRTDIYSLGAALYELLTLQPPFTGQSRDQILGQIMHKEPKALRSVNKKIPLDLETICLKAMEKDPDRRYQTGGEMAEDLRRYVNRFEISARRAGPIQRTVKWARRRPAVAALSASVLLLVLLAGFFALRAQRSEHQLKTAQRKMAIERAMLAARSGDLEEADKAMAVAETLNASVASASRIPRGNAGTTSSSSSAAPRATTAARSATRG
jgi:hypothetical protein